MNLCMKEEYQDINLIKIYENYVRIFNPYRVRRIDQGGIPTLDTIFSNVDTTNNTVTYGICPFQWRQLPCRGLILLNINHTATGATEGSLVSVATSVSSSQVSSNPTSVNTNSGKALLNGSGDQMPTEEISTGNKYLIYYDKRTGVFQTINHKVSFQYQDRTDVNQSMYLLVVMENLRNYQYQLNVQ